MRKQTIEGIASDVKFRAQRRKIGFIALQGYALKHGQGSKPVEEVLSFALKRPDAVGGESPYLRVEMRGLGLDGAVRDGDKLTVCGKLTRDGVFSAKWLRSELTGHKVRAG